MSVFRPIGEPGVLSSKWRGGCGKAETLLIEDRLFMAADCPILSLQTTGTLNTTKFKFFRALRIIKPVEVVGVLNVIGKNGSVAEVELSVLSDYNNHQKTGEWGTTYQAHIHARHVKLDAGAVLLMPAKGDRKIYALTPRQQVMQNLLRVRLAQRASTGLLEAVDDPVSGAHYPLSTQKSLLKKWPDDRQTIDQREDVTRLDQLAKKSPSDDFFTRFDL